MPEEKKPQDPKGLTKGKKMDYDLQSQNSAHIEAVPRDTIIQGGTIKLRLSGFEERPDWVAWAVDKKLVSPYPPEKQQVDFSLDTSAFRHGGIYISAVFGHGLPPEFEKLKAMFQSATLDGQHVERGFAIVPPQHVSASLEQPDAFGTSDQALWVAIRNRTLAIGFERYKQFVDCFLCGDANLDALPQQFTSQMEQYRSNLQRNPLANNGVDAYALLRTATEAFLLLECGTQEGVDGFDAGQHFIRKTSGSAEDPNEPGSHSWQEGTHTEGLEKHRLRRNLGPDEARHQLMQYLGNGKVMQQVLPYIERVLGINGMRQLPTGRHFCNYTLLWAPIYTPCFIELIWSYWHEEGMLIQSMNSIALRFQNRRRDSKGPDPLARFDLDPLRPLNHLLWGWIQESAERLSVARRAYEYDHQYGFSLEGKAIPKLNSADSRVKFIEAFHTLLNLCVRFYSEDADTTVISDGFPLLNGLKEVHMILAQGAHNQFGDLAWTSRVNMMSQQWLMARPEMQDFLRGRYMVPYKESWMGAVDTMKKMQGWSETSITHFSDLGVFGEQLLLSIRYADWSVIHDQEHAKNWARYWKPEVQSYLHSYRATTGMDLGKRDKVDFTRPSLLLAARLKRQAAPIS